MKKRCLFTAVLALLHIAVLNQSDDLLLSFQFIAQGSEFAFYSYELQISLYNMLLNTAMMILLISVICKSISEAFELHPYIFSRGGQIVLKRVMVKRIFKEILFILAAKSLIYVLYFALTQRFTLFFLYDLLSTFLTLGIISSIFLLAKLSGTKDRIPMFALTCGHMVALILSYRISAFSILTISTADWQTLYPVILFAKLCITVTLGVFIIIKKNTDQLLGGKNND